MSVYLGDFDLSATVRFMWNTNDATGASVTRATNGTISVYQNGNTTQTTTGVTDTEDFDSLTGVHLCAVDTSADGTFYAAGRDFAVVLSGATIDGATVNAVLAHFSIAARAHSDTSGVTTLLSRLSSARAGYLDNLSTAPATVGDIPTATQNADALLKRDMSAVTGESARSPLNALRLLRNKRSIAASTLTVTKEDDSTSAWTATLTTDGTAEPVTIVDPV